MKVEVFYTSNGKEGHFLHDVPKYATESKQATNKYLQYSVLANLSGNRKLKGWQQVGDTPRKIESDWKPICVAKEGAMYEQGSYQLCWFTVTNHWGFSRQVYLLKNNQRLVSLPAYDKSNTISSVNKMLKMTPQQIASKEEAKDKNPFVKDPKIQNSYHVKKTLAVHDMCIEMLISGQYKDLDKPFVVEKTKVEENILPMVAAYNDFDSQAYLGEARRSSGALIDFIILVSFDKVKRKVSYAHLPELTGAIRAEEKHSIEKQCARLAIKDWDKYIKPKTTIQLKVGDKFQAKSNYGFKVNEISGNNATITWFNNTGNNKYGKTETMSQKEIVLYIEYYELKKVSEFRLDKQ